MRLQLVSGPKAQEAEMAIQSNAFGRVVLTGADARKFEDQVRYGRLKPAAEKSAKRGAEMLRQMRAKSSSVAVDRGTK
jgi:hypothetical protein